MNSKNEVKADLENYLAREGVSRSYFREEGPTQGTETLRFGMFSQSGTPRQVVRVEWKSVSEITLPHIEVSGESWTLFWLFSELFDELTRPTNAALSPVEFCILLEQHGFKRMAKERNEITMGGEKEEVTS